MSRFIMAFAIGLTLALSAPVLAGDVSLDVQTSEMAATAAISCDTLPDGATMARSCQRCGDGYCAKSCGETAESCPEDCGGVVE